MKTTKRIKIVEFSIHVQNSEVSKFWKNVQKTIKRLISFQYLKSQKQVRELIVLKTTWEGFWNSHLNNFWTKNFSTQQVSHKIVCATGTFCKNYDEQCFHFFQKVIFISQKWCFCDDFSSGTNDVGWNLFLLLGNFNIQRSLIDTVSHYLCLSLPVSFYPFLSWFNTLVVSTFNDFSLASSSFKLRLQVEMNKPCFFHGFGMFVLMFSLYGLKGRASLALLKTI